MKIFRTILFTILFIATGYLYYDNLQKSQRIENLEKYSKELASTLNDFHSSLYAAQNPVADNGAHILYVSDEYYRSNFKNSK